MITRSEKRGAYTKARRKKFLFLKHTKRLAEYYKYKSLSSVKINWPDKKKSKTLWERIVAWFHLLLDNKKHIIKT